MSIKESKQALERYYELFNQKEFDKCDQLIAPGFISHRTTGDVFKEHMKKGIEMLVLAFPDMRLSIEHIVAEGDMVSFREVVTATHTGNFMGIPPTGKPFRMINACTLRVTNGKWAEAWTTIDDLNMLQQIGVIPIMGKK